MIKLLTTEENYKDCLNEYLSDNEFQVVGKSVGKTHYCSISGIDITTFGKIICAMGLKDYIYYCADDETIYIHYYIEEETAND